MAWLEPSISWERCVVWSLLEVLSVLDLACGIRKVKLVLMWVVRKGGGVFHIVVGWGSRIGGRRVNLGGRCLGDVT